MDDKARTAALAERERIAKLAEECDAGYQLNWRRVEFAELIRTGATRPPWALQKPPDPLAT